MHGGGVMKSDKEIKVSDDFWSKVQVTKKENKKPVHLRIDADVFRFFMRNRKEKDISEKCRMF